MSYVEFPADRIVNVHWHKKDGNGGGDGDLPKYPCGMFGPAAGEPWPWWYTHCITSPGVLLMERYGMPDTDEHGWIDDVSGYNGPSDPVVPDLYYWGPGVTRYTITSFSRHGNSPNYIRLFYNTNSWNMAPDTEPDEVHVGGAVVTVDIDIGQILGTGDLLMFDCAFGHSFTVQAHCEFETTGAPPPQPGPLGGNGWPPGRYPDNPSTYSAGRLPPPDTPGLTLQERARNGSLLRPRPTRGFDFRR